MKTRHLGRALVALVAAAATIGLMGNPASANDAEITGGTLELFDFESNQIHQQDLGTTTNSVECSDTVTTLTVTGTNHAWTFNHTSHTSAFLAGTGYTIEFVVQLHGTSSSTGTSTVNPTSSGAVSTLYENSSSTSGSTPTHCPHLDSTQDPCVITIVNIGGTATHNVTSTGVTASSTATVNGGTVNDHGQFAFDVDVTGPGEVCGGLISAIDGGATMTNVVVHALN